MSKRIIDKIEEIEGYLQELNEIVPLNFEEYKSYFVKKAVCERYFEKIIEAVVDLAFLTIKEKEFQAPEEDKEAFDILFGENIISRELSERIKDAKGMRNVIAHEYGKVDDEMVFNAVSEELPKDASGFVRIIKRIVK